MKKNYFFRHPFEGYFRYLCFLVLLISFNGNSQNSKLYSFGTNTYGQLGTGNTTSQNSPTLIGEGNDWKIVSAGSNHSLAIKSDGTLWAWGYGSNGRLGTGSTANQLSPVQIGSGTNWKHVSAGNNHSLAVKTDGTLWAWGSGTDGKLGLGTNTQYTQPVQIGTATNWKEVSAGEKHSLALKTDGTIWSWGDNASGKLGTGLNNYQWTPTQISSATNWIQIFAADDHSLAVQSNGYIWAWGSGEHGRLGVGNTNQQNSMVTVGSDNDWVMVSSKDSHTLALKSDGTLWGWGRNSRLGIGNLYGNQLTPIQIGTDTDWTFINAGSSFSHAIKSDGTLWAWGTGSQGVLGTGNTNDQDYPTQVGTDTYSFISSAFGYHSLALSSELSCPNSNVTFNSQAEINNFGIDYQHCTAIVGNLYIAGNDITDLTPLSNIISIAGNLHIQDCPNLITLAGLNNVNSVTSGLLLYNLPSLSNIEALSNITSLGWILNIYNTHLTTLNGLQNITAINGGLSITDNTYLNDISAIENIAATSINDAGVYIVGNTSLMVCYLDNICTYLANNSVTHPRTIFGNAGNCYESAISLACGGNLSYCTPMSSASSASYGIYIYSFTTINGVTNFSNLSNGFSQNGYHDYTSTHSLSQYTYQNVSFGLHTGNANPVGVRIWIDWNKDFEFANDGSEIVYTSAQDFVGTHYGSFVIPGNVPMGDYRMRVLLKYDSSAFDPCEVTGNVTFYGETEDYTITILGQVPCEAPTNLTPTEITENSATISWQSAGSVFDIEWGPSGFTQGTGTIQNGITENSYIINELTLGTTYDFYVRNNCSSTQSGGISNWVKYSFTTIAATNYCEPTYNSTDVDNYGIYINSVQTNNAVTNISNLSSGYNGNGYGNFSTTYKVSELQGGSFSITITPKALNMATKVATVWVDWNKDNVFNEDEIAYEIQSATLGNFNANIAVPNTQTPGEYRMRVAIRNYVNNHFDMNPCGENQWGEAEDYTLYVIDSSYDCTNPTNIVASNISFNNATFSWTSTGSNFEIKYGLPGHSDAFLTFLTTNEPTVTINELTENKLYDIYIRQNCDAVFGGSSEWVKYTFSTIGYCVPVMNATSGNTNVKRYIQSVVTSGGVTNFSNVDNGYYIFNNNSNTHFVSQHPTESFYIAVTPTTPISSNISSISRIKVWVDWNNDLTFNEDNSELAYNEYGAYNGATQNIAMEVPFGVQSGNYRMRIMITYGFTGDSCLDNHLAYGETEDYTVTVLEAVGCPTPTQMYASEIQRESATINWASQGNSFDIEWGLAGFTQGTGNITSTTALSHSLTGLTAGITYDFYVRRTDCNLYNAEQSNWKLLPFTTTNYCVDYPSYEANPYISNFKTYHAETNIYNNNSLLSDRAYGNFSATHIASAVSGEDISFEIKTVGSLSQIVYVWVDWNNDGTLNNTNELVKSFSGTNNSTFSGSFAIPAGTQAGNYRMRLIDRKSVV